MNRVIACLVFVLIAGIAAPGPAPAQEKDPVQRSRELARRARDAYDHHDYATSARFYQEAVDLRPNHPTLVYNLAAVYALNGQVEASLSTLDRLVRMGIYVDPVADPDFGSLLMNPDFVDRAKRLQANGKPHGTSATVFTVPEPGFVPEGVAYDPAGDAYFLGSVHRRKIVRVVNGKAETFADRDDGLWSVMGMRVDPVRKLLWVTTTASKNGEDVPEADIGKAALVAFDPASGKVVGRFPPPYREDPYWLGDLCLDARGSVYVSDSAVGAIYVHRAGADTLELVTGDVAFGSLQGLCLSGDGRYLFAADYGNGIFRIDVESKEVRLLDCPPSATLLGIDGLDIHRGKLIAVQNGIRPNRIIEVTLNGDRTAIRSVEVLASALPEWDEPTLGMVRGGGFIYVADSQWNKFAQDGTLPEDAGLLDPRVMRVSLD
jgi:DNA-binding beta-propeller fold protein YncE